MRILKRTGLALAALMMVAGCAAPTEPSATTPPVGTTAAAPSTSASAAPSTSATPSPSPSPSVTAAPSTSASTSAAPKGIDGRWCPVKGSTSTGCLTVTGTSVKIADGNTYKLSGGARKTSDGGLSYSFADSPFGIYYPAGTSIKLPDYFGGKDQPKQDRIWNGQTADLYVREAKQVTAPSTVLPDYPDIMGFPAALQGKWCDTSGKTCFSPLEMRQEHPESGYSSQSPSEDVPGATDFVLCYAPDLSSRDCTTAASVFVRFFPAGTEWNCKSMGTKRYGFSRCKPDYTADHKSSRDRLVILPNHQHDSDYIDTPPMYKVAG